MLKNKSPFIAGIIFWLTSIAASGQYKTLLTVAQDGTGDFTAIQEAINSAKAFPDERITIFIRKGIYKEKVKVHAWNTCLSIIGENRDSTIITWDDHFSKINLGRNSTFHTYTMLVEANDMILKNLTIQNSAGPIGQAVTLHVDADRVMVNNCNILGHQDALYVAGEQSRQYFNNCFIEGTTDFIFGAATAVFYDCVIHSKSNSYITAASTPQSSSFGFVFIDCNLTAVDEVNRVYLGRPWRRHAKTVFINCQLDAHILPTGWDNWRSEANERTAYYAEYNSKGEGANPRQRVKWSHQLTKKDVSLYSMEAIFKDWKIK